MIYGDKNHKIGQLILDQITNNTTIEKTFQYKFDYFIRQDILDQLTNNTIAMTKTSVPSIYSISLYGM